MSYENHMPPLSTIDQGTRDFDFIPLTELKEFDEKLNEIVTKISAIDKSNSSDITSIAYKLKEIEYNLADAIEFDEDGNVVSLKSATSNKFGDETGNASTVVPDQGPNAYDTLMSNLEKYYNEFVKYLGNDVESDQWKIDLQKIFIKAKTGLDDKISAIFGNSAQASILEEKENDKFNFMKQDSVKLKTDDIMRLNPNFSNYVRNINLIFETPGKELIAFEVECAEPDNMIFNMKLQNGDLYYNYNVILDNGKFHITKDEHFKLCNYGLELRIYKYVTVSKTWRYVFTLSSSSEDISKVYSFELSGIFINRFIFDTNGAFPTDHENYWAFHKVDTTGRVDPEKTYYERRVDDYNDERNTETNIVYTAVDKSLEPLPIPGEVYYVKTVDESDTIVYAEYRELVEFEPDITYFKKHIETATDDSDKIITYVEIDDLKEFKPGVDYYVKETEFIYVDKLNISETEQTDGEIDDITIDHKGEKIINENFKKVIANRKYTKTPIKMMNIDVESSELLTNKKYKETIANIPNSNVVHLDDGIRFTKTSTPGLLVKSRNGARKINNTFNVGFGSKIVELRTIRPHYYEVVCNSSVKKSNISPISNGTISDKTDDGLSLKETSFTINNHTIKYISNDISLYDMYVREGKPLIAIKFDDIDLLSFNDIILETSNFINTLRIECAGYVGNSMLDFKVIADDIDDFENCYHIYINIKDEEIAIPVLKKVINDGKKQNTPIKLENIEQIITNGEYSFIIDTNENCYESSDGIVWYKKNFIFDKEFTQNLNCDNVKVAGFVRDDYTKKIFAIIIPDNLSLKNIPIKKIVYSEIKGSSDYIKFDTYAEYIFNAYNTKLSDSTYNSYTPYDEDRGYGIALYNNIMVCILTQHGASASNNNHAALSINLSTNLSWLQLHTTKRILEIPNLINNRYNVVYTIPDDATKIYQFKAKISMSTTAGSNVMTFVIKNVTSSTSPLSETLSTETNPQIYTAQYNNILSNTVLPTICKAFSCINEKYSGGSDNPYEGYFIYVKDGENGAYHDNLGSGELVSIPVFEGIKVYNVVYCGDVNKKIAFAFTDHGLYVNLTQDPNNFTLANIEDAEFDENSSVVFSNSTDIFNYTWTIFGVNKFIYTHDGLTYHECEKPGIFSLKNIGDIDGNILIGKTVDNSVISDVYDNLFVRNNYDKNRNLYYKKVGNYIFGYGNGNNNTYIIDWVSNDKHTYTNVKLDNVYDIDGEIYGIYNTTENVIIYKFIDEATGFVDISETARTTFTKPLNIKDIQQDINGNIFVIGADIEHNKGVIYYGENISQLDRVLTLSEDGVIDCLFIYDNDVIISTYEPYNETRQYKWDPITKVFSYKEEANINLNFSFKRCYAYNGEIFVMNGSGSNPNIVEKGFAKLTKEISKSHNKGYWNINVITPITENFEIKHDNYIFSYANTLFGIFIEKRDGESDKQFHIYVYYEDAGRFIEVNAEIAPLLTAIVNTGNDELQQEKSSSKNEYTMCIQETYNESKSPIRNYKPEDENENYRLDKIYFDRENSGITIGNYASETNRFNMISRMAAIGITGNKHKSQLAMVLGKDNLLGIYDKSMRTIETFKFKYDVTMDNGIVKRVDVDDRFITQNIFVASDAENNYAFISVRGKFPTFNVANDDVTIEETQSSLVTYKLFKVNITDKSQFVDDYIILNLEDFSITENTTTEEIRNYINSTYGYDVSDDMILNVFNDRQLIGIVKGFMYNNIESIVFWNTESMCIDILSPLDWNENIDDVNAQFNRNNNYRDYNLAIDTVNNKAYQILFDGTGEISGTGRNKVSFTSIPNELVRVGLKTYIANDFLKSVKDISFKDIDDRAASAQINLDVSRNKYEQSETTLTSVKTAENQARELFDTAYANYTSVLNELNEAIINSNARLLLELQTTLNEKTNEQNLAQIELNDAIVRLNNVSVDSEEYQSLLEAKNQAQERYDAAVQATNAAQEAYSAELLNSNSQEIIRINEDLETAKRQYQNRLVEYNTAKNNTSIAQANRDKAYNDYETAQMIYDSMKSKSLIDTITFDNGLVGKIDSNIVLDRLIHTKFGAIAWDSLVSSKLNPNSRNDLHYIITKSGKIVLDSFTGNGVRYYNNVLTTRVGLFRWYDFGSSDEFGSVVENPELRPLEYEVDSDGYNTGWVYLVPTGGGKLIKIDPGVGKYVYKMWDTPIGVFMAVRNYRYYGLSPVEYWSFKQLVGVPVNDTKIISIDDEQYFKDLNCNEIKIEDCCITQNGLFIVGHSNNKWVTLKFNGDDFYAINTTVHIKNIIDTTIGTLFITDSNNEAVYKYNGTSDSLVLDTSITIGDVNLESKFGQKRNDIETIFGPQIGVKGGVWNLSLLKKIAFEDTNGKGPAALQKLRVYINDENDNLPAISKYLFDKGLPLDIDIKCVGSIMYNGLQVLINGLQIISENGLSKKPQTVKFYIDKNARFTRNRQTIEALFGTDDSKWDSKDIGLISDYDPETGNYYDIPCQISKMNFMVLYE